jgi:hypothetical protein
MRVETLDEDLTGVSIARLTDPVIASRMCAVMTPGTAADSAPVLGIHSTAHGRRARRAGVNVRLPTDHLMEGLLMKDRPMNEL